tara:strand:- start:164 stop:325 length:162 start_codon:yes stop_codon:yes gene_type:complete
MELFYWVKPIYAMHLFKVSSYIVIAVLTRWKVWMIWRCGLSEKLDSGRFLRWI